MNIIPPGCNKRVFEWIRSSKTNIKCTFRKCNNIPARETPIGIYCLDCYLGFPNCKYCGNTTAPEPGERKTTKAICEVCGRKDNIPQELIRQQIVETRCSNISIVTGTTRDLSGISSNDFIEELDTSLDKNGISPKTKRMAAKKSWAYLGIYPKKRINRR